MAWWLMPWTPDPEVGGSSPTRVKPCCALEQGTFTPQKSTGNTQEVMALSQHDRKIVNRDVKNQSTLKTTKHVKRLSILHVNLFICLIQGAFIC